MHETVCVSFHNRIGAAKVIWSVFLGEWLATNRVFLSVRKDASATHVSVVNVKLPADLCQKQRPKQVVT